MGEEEVKVLSTWPSMFGMRVLIALEEKGVKYVYEEENPQQKSETLLKYNPVHKLLPVLIHKGKPVCESLNIVQYIDEAWNSPELPTFFRKNPYDRAIARFWGDYVDKKFYDAMARIVRQPPGEIQEQGKADLINVILTLDAALEEVACGQPFYGGDRLGFVDIAVAPFICWFKGMEEIGNFQLIDEDKSPTFCSWMKTVTEVPSVKNVLQPPEKVAEFAREMRARYVR